MQFWLLKIKKCTSNGSIITESQCLSDTDTKFRCFEQDSIMKSEQTSWTSATRTLRSVELISVADGTHGIRMSNRAARMKDGESPNQPLDFTDPPRLFDSITLSSPTSPSKTRTLPVDEARGARSPRMRRCQVIRLRRAWT